MKYHFIELMLSANIGSYSVAIHVATPKNLYKIAGTEITGKRGCERREGRQKLG
jgi:hypothetical protein